MPAQAHSTISVIVPVHLAGRRVQHCLGSLAQAQPPPHEIIVVSDGDRAEVKQLAHEFKARVLFTRTRGGPARARNKGARAATGDLLFFVDADVTVPPDALSRIQEEFRAHPEISALFGSYDDEPACHNFLSQYRNLLHHYVHQGGKEDASTFWAGCGVIRREVFLSLGGFSKKYRRPTLEDVELGYRLKKAGGHIRLCKSLLVKHLKRWRLGNMLMTDLFGRAVPWSELILRDRSLINDLNLNNSGRASVGLAFLSLAALAGAVWWRPALAVAAAGWLGLVVLNAPLYKFFYLRRGGWFALRALPVHFLYFICCGLGFGIGLARFMARRRKREWAPAPLIPLKVAGSTRESQVS